MTTKCQKCGGVFEDEPSSSAVKPCPYCYGDASEPYEGHKGYKGRRAIGWECPRCHKVHAPWVPTCKCAPPVKLEAYSVE